MENLSKERRIEVITYEQDRLNYFERLMDKANKRYKHLYAKFKDAPYLSAEAQALSDAGRETRFLGDVVEMLEKGYRKQKEGEWVKTQFLARSGFYTIKEFPCNKCGERFEVAKGNERMHFCPNCGAKMKGGAE